MSEETISQRVQACLDRLRVGDQSVHDELWDLVNDRITILCRKIKHLDYSSLAKWAQTEDIAQDARLRLLRALRKTVPQTPRDFYGLANLQIRRELLDTIRRMRGRNHDRDAPLQLADSFEGASDTYEPVGIQAWGDFHEAVERLPAPERESFEMWYYQGMSHDEIAEVLGVDKTTVKRRCRTARTLLARFLPQDLKEPTDPE